MSEHQLDLDGLGADALGTDTTTLSHILAVSTPRQLSPKEQSRRREILDILEQCEARKKKKSDSIKQFQQRQEAMRKKFRDLRGSNYNFDHNGDVIPIHHCLPPIKNGTNTIPVTTKIVDTQPESELSPKKHRRKPKRLRLDKLEPAPHGGYVPAILPQLDTARLVEGVRAIHMGVEKEGPKRVPSRRTRILRHNYRLKQEEIRKLEEGAKEETTLPEIGTNGSPKAVSEFVAEAPVVLPELKVKLPTIPKADHLKKSAETMARASS